MPCGCAMGYEDEGDVEPATIWHEGRVQRSRKEHRCCECGDKIPEGTAHCYATALFDGRWETWRRCLSCSALAELIATINGACPLWGMLEASCDWTEGVSWKEWREKAKATT